MALVRHGGRLLPRAACLLRTRALPPAPLPHRFAPPPCAPPPCPVAARAYAAFQPAWRAPPPPSALARARAALDSRPDAALWGLIAANVGVFGLWHTQSQRQMARHFMVWPADAFELRRCYTLLTCAFSHREGWHLASNMVSLYFFGREVGRLFGGVRLLQLYAAGGVAASAMHVAWSRREWTARHPAGMARAWGISPSGPPALGASGAVNAIVLFDTLLFPWRIIYVNFIIPMPALVLGGLVLMRDAWGAWDSGGVGRGGVAHAGHIGGAAVGAAAWAALQLRTRRRW